MKKHVFGRQLSRDINERKALFKGLINALVMEESIKTTEAKAKSIRGQVEKLITKAKRKGDGAKSLLQPWLQPVALEKVMKDLSVRFANRPGGYTRIMTLGERFGDNATMVVIEFVEKSIEPGPKAHQPLAEKVKAEKKEKVEATVKAKEQKSKPAKKSQEPKESKKAGQRPPSKAEMEKRKETKGSPVKERSKKATVK